MSSSLNTEISRDFLDMLGLLSKHHVEYLLIGGYAVGLHRVPRFTGDIDLWVRPTLENAQRVWRALTEFGAPLSQFAVEDFTNEKIFVQFGVPPNRIDIAMSIEGVNFDEAWKEHLSLQIGDQVVTVISLKHLLQNKTAVGRPKDLLDVKMLEAQHNPNRKPKPRNK